jgi:hypothetical protein
LTVASNDWAAVCNASNCSEVMYSFFASPWYRSTWRRALASWIKSRARVARAWSRALR